MTTPRKEKMQNILATIGVDVDRDGAEAKFINILPNNTHLLLKVKLMRLLKLLM